MSGHLKVSLLFQLFKMTLLVVLRPYSVHLPSETVRELRDKVCNIALQLPALVVLCEGCAEPGAPIGWYLSEIRVRTCISMA